MVSTRVAVGGTFYPLHKGHLKLFKKASEIGEEIVIGLTSDEMVEKMDKKTPSFETRKENIKNHLKNIKGISYYFIIKIHDFIGPALSESINAIVVSPETEIQARKINKIRKELGIDKIKIIVVDFELSEDGTPISSSKIRKGIIDKDGRLIK